LKEVPVAEAPSSETIDRLRGAVTRITRVFDRQVSAGGLTRTQLSVLASVDTRGPIGLGELADIEGVNPTMLSRIVGKLEDAGLIQRQPDPDDRRAARVDVTAAGAKVRRKLLAERSRLLAERLAALPDDQVALLLAALPALEALSAQPAQVLSATPGARA
jgi:DNA-binding MarR family transcriptional regulator